MVWFGQFFGWIGLRLRTIRPNQGQSELGSGIGTCRASNTPKHVRDTYQLISHGRIIFQTGAIVIWFPLKQSKQSPWPFCSNTETLIFWMQKMRTWKYQLMDARKLPGIKSDTQTSVFSLPAVKIEASLRSHLPNKNQQPQLQHHFSKHQLNIRNSHRDFFTKTPSVFMEKFLQGRYSICCRSRGQTLDVEHQVLLSSSKMSRASPTWSIQNSKCGTFSEEKQIWKIKIKTHAFFLGVVNEGKYWIEIVI